MRNLFTNLTAPAVAIVAFTFIFPLILRLMTYDRKGQQRDKK